MIRITENEIPILKKYGMKLKEIVERYHIVECDLIQKVFEVGERDNVSITEMAHRLQLSYNRVYHYYRRFKDGKPLKVEVKYNIDDKLIKETLDFFDKNKKDNGQQWTMQDFAIFISEGLEDMPSTSYCKKRIEELNLNWRQFK